MSYILDALRKADAQRERDSSRGIHAHPTPLGASGAAGGARAPWLWGAAAMVIALVAAGTWYFSRDKEAAPTTQAVAIPPPAVAAAPVIPAAANAEAPPAAVTPAPQAANVIAPPPPAPAPAPAPEVRESRVPRQGGMLPPPQAQMPAQMPVVPAPAPAPAPATAAAPAPATTGLPADAPRLAISGGVYSPSPAQRMLIVNGQVFNEGSEVAPGVTIDEIKPRTAVLKFRGARYTVAY